MDSVGTWSANGKGCGEGVTCNVASMGSATLVRGVCPEGWHLPDTTEWSTLFTAVGGSSVAGTKLKSTSGWYNSGNGTDAFSFSALPAGNRNSNGNYSHEGDNAFFWSSTEFNSNRAYHMNLYYGYDGALLDYSNEGNGYSVRCLQD